MRRERLASRPAEAGTADQGSGRKGDSGDVLDPCRKLDRGALGAKFDDPRIVAQPLQLSAAASLPRPVVERC